MEDSNLSTSNPRFIVDGLEDRCGNTPLIKLDASPGNAPGSFVLQTKGFTCSLEGGTGTEKTPVGFSLRSPSPYLSWRSIGVSIPSLFADNELCFLYTNEPKIWMPTWESNPALRFTRPVHHHNACRQKMVARQGVEPCSPGWKPGASPTMLTRDRFTGRWRNAPSQLCEFQFPRFSEEEIALRVA